MCGGTARACMWVCVQWTCECVEARHVLACGWVYSGHVNVWRHTRACMWVGVQWTCECVEARHVLACGCVCSGHGRVHKCTLLLISCTFWPLVVWDIFIVSLLMVLVIKLDFSFPSSLKGLLFYIQTVYYVTEYFPSSFWDARKYVSLLRIIT